MTLDVKTCVTCGSKFHRRKNCGQKAWERAIACSHRCATLARSKPLKERIMDRVHFEPISGCWIWAGVMGQDGYGHILVDGATKRPHRVSYEAFIGPIPDGFVVMHKCVAPLIGMESRPTSSAGF